MLMVLASAAYSPKWIMPSLENMGFSIDDQHMYDYYGMDALNESEYVNTVSFSLSSKKADDGTTVVAVIMRGSYGGIDKWSVDWQSNASFIRDYGSHPGFEIAAEKVYKQLTSYDQATATVSFAPATIGDRTITVGSVMEGKNPVTDVLDLSYSDGKLTVKPGNVPNDEKAHTYKVYLAVDGKDAGALTVKTLANKAKVIRLFMFNISFFSFHQRCIISTPHPVYALNLHTPDEIFIQ